MSDRRAHFLATLLLYLWAAVPALISGLPVALLVGGLWGHHPGGDARLWEPGAFHLVETLHLLIRDVAALTWGAPWMLLAWALLGVVPQALSLAVLDEPDDGGERLTRATQAISPLILLVGVMTLIRVVLVLLCMVANRALEPGLAAASDPARDLAHGVVALLALALLSVARVLHDLAAAATIRRGEKGPEAMLTGLEILHRRFVPAVLAWLGPALLTLVALALATALGGLWHAGLGLALATIIHQLGLFAAVWLRVGWLRRALSLVQGPRPEA